MCVGGAQIIARELCRDLSQRYSITFAFGPDVGDEGSLEESVEELFPVIRLPRLRRAIHPVHDAMVVRDLRQVMRDLNPHLVHTHSSKAGIVGRIAAVRSGAAVVHSVHGWGHTPQDPAWKKRLLVGAECWAARRTDALVAASEDVREEGLALGIGRPDQWRVVSSYVDIAPLDPDFRRSRARARSLLRLTDSDRVVGWVGRFMPQKDPATLAATCLSVLSEVPDAKVVFVGDGPERRAIERRIAQAGHEERVLFTGFRPDVRQLYSAFDVLLHTSLWEGQPRVIQEAVAERIPVVAARVTGTRDLFAIAPIGIEVDPGDVRGFAEEVRRRLTNPCAPLPSSAVERLSEKTGRNFARRAYFELYDALLSGSRLRRTSAITE
jgi:glycosyltransferase involved in cell wall biosynthesis